MAPQRTVAARVTRWLARRGFGDEESLVEDEPDDAGLLLQAASAAGRAALGKRAGRLAQRIRTVAGRVVRLPPRCAALDGTNVHAGVVVGGHDEEGVEPAGDPGRRGGAALQAAVDRSPPTVPALTGAWGPWRLNTVAATRPCKRTGPAMRQPRPRSRQRSSDSTVKVDESSIM